MSRLKLNIIANIAGQGWTALMSLVFIPLYIQFLGIEAYGLIGFFAMLQATLLILDFGLSQTMNRELARYSVQPEKANEARDFVRSLEIGYWGIGLLMGAVIVLAAPFIAGKWIKAGTIPIGTVQQAVMVMGIVVALQWPLSLYGSGLMGLQRQVLFNGIKVGMSTLGGGGAVLVLWLVLPSITAFFTWQIIVSAVQITLVMIFLWRSLPCADHAPRFQLRLVRGIWRFAAGMGGITLFGVILMQMDKVILSKLLSLKMFGYYTLAGVVSSAMHVMLAGSVFSGIFPRFSSLVARNDETSLILLYHQGTQLLAVLMLPVSVLLAFFSYDIMLLWTRNAEIALYASPIVSLLVTGMALNGLMAIPYALQLSHGWTSIGLFITIFLIITLVPSVYFMATRYGAIGAASVWVALNGIYMLIGAPLTHRRLLKGELRRWLVEDIWPPLGASLLIVGVGRLLITGPMPAITSLAVLLVILLSAFMAAALAASHVRAWLLIRFKRVSGDL